jgi:hypothetical protein
MKTWVGAIRHLSLGKKQSRWSMEDAPHRGGAACLTYALGPRLIAVGDMGAQGCNGTSFPISLYIYIYVDVKMYVIVAQREKRDKEWKNDRADVTPSFKAKPNAHSMCDQESSLHTYCIENRYRRTNVTI